jgi:beta-1,4-N-acetylglucosaminyltransferase
MKICLVCNPGGHFLQLQLLREAWAGCEVFYVLGRSPALDGRGTVGLGRCYFLRLSDRKRPMSVLLNIWDSLRILLRERPDAIVSTGASIAVPVCYVGRALRIPVIWVDSMANTKRLSLSGRLARFVARRVYTQHAPLATPDGRVRFRGRP